MGRRPRDAESAGARTMSDRKNVKPDTKLVSAGRRKEWTQGIVSPPVWRASTILFEDVAEMEAAEPPRDGTLQYGRNGTPTTWALCEALTGLERGAALTRLYPSGSAAVAGALLSVLSAGDELLMVDTAYGPTRAFCDSVLKRFGVATRYYDPLIGAGIADLIGERTRAIFLESPGTYTFEVQDIPAICAAAKARDVATLIDNTWATPLFLPAIELGIDVSIVACTKYIGGHADLMLGSVTVNEAFAQRLERTRRVLGQTAGPDDAWLALRGLRTLAVRLARHHESGLRVARWLADHPKVARVLHPALPDCPGHDLFLRDFKGASGLFSFVLKGGEAAAQTRLIESLDLFGIGYSWGAFESLALPGHFTRTATKPEFEGPMVRLHIGLEDPDDLIADLEQALAGYPG